MHVRSIPRVFLVGLFTLALTTLAPPAAASAAGSAGSGERQLSMAVLVPNEPSIPCTLQNDGEEAEEGGDKWQCFCDPKVDSQGRLIGGYTCKWYIVELGPAGEDEFRNNHSSLAMDVQHSNAANGTIIWQFTPNGTNAQLYTLTRKDQGAHMGFQIRTVVSGSRSCVGVAGGVTTQSAKTIEWACNGNPDQSWMFRTLPGWGSSFEVWNLNSRFCLSVPSASQASGVQLEQFHCGNQPGVPFVDQLWHF